MTERDQRRRSDSRQGAWIDCCESFESLLDALRRHCIQIDPSLNNDNLPACLTFKSNLIENVYNNSIGQIEGASNLFHCSQNEYGSGLRRLLEIEELYQAIQARKLGQSNIKLRLVVNKVWQIVEEIGFKCPNLASATPTIVVKDYVVLNFNDNSGYITQIMNIDNDYVSLQRDGCYAIRDRFEQPVTVSFVPAGTPFRYCHRAIDRLRNKTSMQATIFENNVAPCASTAKVCAIKGPYADRLNGRLVRLNACQRRAIMGVLEARCRPRPYIVFGPPGTGKTYTIIEAIVQVYLRSRLRNSDLSPPARYRILACSSSNLCADMLYKSISHELPNARVVRLFAGSSPTRDDYLDIAVTTNIKSGAYAQFGMQFDYVFIDEAGHANVAESFVPMSLLRFNGCLVLAGDPHQLGPVVMCREAAQMGLGESLLERIFKFSSYKEDCVTLEYDSNYITMLQECYRCDERLLYASNHLFYNNKLKCRQQAPKSLLNILNFERPLQILRVNGTQARVPDSDSLFNQIEIEACVDLVHRLLLMGMEPHQIGITSPYKLQVLKIRTMLELSLNHDNPVTKIISNRFAQVAFMPIKEYTDLQDEDAVLELDLPSGAELYTRTSASSFVPCKRANFPTNLDNLFVRRVLRASNWVSSLKVDTIDAFQGGEREIMIISTVRSEHHGLEFISDERRFNVAVSRAKWLVIILGNPSVLERTRCWKTLLEFTGDEINNWPKLTIQNCPFWKHSGPIFN